MSEILIRNLNFSYADSLSPVFENLTLNIDTSWKTALVGDNGRGKTTLLKLICGQLNAEGSICANTAFRLFPFAVSDENAIPYDLFSKAAPDSEEWEILREVNLIGLDTEVLFRPFKTLSGGEKTKFCLALTFASKGFALIDEPTDHLDAFGRKQLAAYLSRKYGFIVVSHDKAFLDGCCDHVLAIEGKTVNLTRGNYSVYAQEKVRREQADKTRKQTLEGERARLKKVAARTSEWGVSAEREKFNSGEKYASVDRGFLGAKAAKLQKRAAAVSARQAKAEGEIKELLKNFTEEEELKIFPEKFFRTRLLTLSNLTLKTPAKTLFDGFDLTVDSGERIALVGKNGCGKSTLLKLICGGQIDFQGTADISPRLKISYVEQECKMQGTLSQYAQSYGIDEGYYKAILAKFGFDKKDFTRDISLFSQGQKKKAALARSLSEMANLYIWDEPLNYLDVRSRERIERAVKNSGATLIFVEHDLSFVNSVATKIINL
ncbi:MAG: ATP-binding cassette domain-containing protein [Clostridia bacterium]|nr:ATP-binding cassette domain-containing protein [Clostridia bacterium]